MSRPRCSAAEILAAAEEICRETPVDPDGIPLSIMMLLADRLRTTRSTLHRWITAYGIRGAIADVMARHRHTVHPMVAHLAARDSDTAACVHACVGGSGPFCTGR